MKVRNPVAVAILALTALLATSTAFADDVSIPNTFQANSPAVAAEVNGNFSAVETAVDDNDSRIDVLLAAVATLQATVDTQATTIADLQSDLAAVQGSNVMALAPYLVLLDVPDTVNPSILYPTVQFSGVNVQIVNGSGNTSTTNGLGNLTIGYNQSRIDESNFCSDGTYGNQPDCVNNGGVWAADQRSGSHNLILGRQNAYSQSGGLVAGTYNIINGKGASIIGGNNNTASGNYSSVSGGAYNTASGGGSVVSGGYQNTASGSASSVSGGGNNTASGYKSSISGGISESATGLNDWRAGNLFQDN